jgi:hypothetical protein
MVGLPRGHANLYGRFRVALEGYIFCFLLAASKEPTGVVDSGTFVGF